MVAEKNIEAGYRDELKGTPKVQFDYVNPPYYGRGYVDQTGSVFATIGKIETVSHAAVTRYDMAAQQSREPEISRAMLEVTKERLEREPKPTPPMWADDGRGGAFDRRSVYAEARNRVDGAAEYHRQQILEDREAQKQSAIEDAERQHAKRHEQPLTPKFQQGVSTMTNQSNMPPPANQPGHQTPQLSPAETLRAQLHDLIQESHDSRTQAGKTYYENRPAIIEQMKDDGEKNPAVAAGVQQKQVIENGISQTHNQLDGIIDRAFNINRDQGYEQQPAQQQPAQDQGMQRMSHQEALSVVNNLMQNGGQATVQNGQVSYTDDAAPAQQQPQHNEPSHYQSEPASQPAQEQIAPEPSHTHTHDIGHSR